MDTAPKCLLLYLCKYINVKSRLQLSMCNKTLHSKLCLSQEEQSLVTKAIDFRKKESIYYYGFKCSNCNTRKDTKYYELLNQLSNNIIGYELSYDIPNDMFVDAPIYHQKYKYLCKSCYNNCPLSFYGCEQCGERYTSYTIDDDLRKYIATCTNSDHSMTITKGQYTYMCTISNKN